MSQQQGPSSDRVAQAQTAAAVLQSFDAATLEFMQNWVAFNAFYGHGGGRERERLLQCVAESLDDAQASALLRQLESTTAFFTQLPPADGRFQPTDPRFRARAAFDLRKASDPAVPSPQRLGHLVACVYQVRCNLFHGMKAPLFNPRDAALVQASLVVTKAVVAALLRTGNTPPLGS